MIREDAVLQCHGRAELRRAGRDRSSGKGVQLGVSTTAGASEQRAHAHNVWPTPWQRGAGVTSFAECPVRLLRMLACAGAIFNAAGRFAKVVRSVQSALLQGKSAGC